MKVDEGAIKGGPTIDASYVPMEHSIHIEFELLAKRPRPSAKTECKNCGEALELEEGVISKCRPGNQVVFPCPKCGKLKVIALEWHLVIGDVVTEFPNC